LKVASYARLDTYRDNGRRSSATSKADAEMESLRQRYLGNDAVNDVRRKRTDKRYRFDWDETDDTSQDANPIYAQRSHVLMFGRGTLGGIDVKEQEKKRSAYYNKLIEERRTDEDRERAEYVFILS
jgi:ATP-dependent RNA helicase DDX23/PRP28